MIELAKAKGWLTEDEIQSIQEGKMTSNTNYRHRDMIKDKNQESASTLYKDFLVLFRLIPLLPCRLIEYISAKRLYRFFNILPGQIIDFLSIINMIKMRERLQMAHYRYYLDQIVKLIFKFKINI